MRKFRFATCHLRPTPVPKVDSPPTAKYRARFAVFPARYFFLESRRYLPPLASISRWEAGRYYFLRAIIVAPLFPLYYCLYWAGVIVSVNSRCYRNLSLDMYLEIPHPRLGGFSNLRVSLTRAICFPGIEAVLVLPIFDIFAGRRAALFFCARAM